MTAEQRLTRAEQRERTRYCLVQAAAKVFSRRGYEKASLDEVAEEAGFTKGAVYSNFASKEDLFFAVYEARVEAAVADLARRLTDAPDFPTAAEQLARDSLARRGRDDGWLAVFFEFWAHVLRNPEHRQRFSALRRRALEPMIRGVQELARERGTQLPLSPELVATANVAMGNGMQLERLSRPEEIDVETMQQVAQLLAAGFAPRRRMGAK